MSYTATVLMTPTAAVSYTATVLMTQTAAVSYTATVLMTPTAAVSYTATVLMTSTRSMLLLFRPATSDSAAMRPREKPLLLAVPVLW